jgi:hypothetical protein
LRWQTRRQNNGRVCALRAQVSATWSGGWERGVRIVVVVGHFAGLGEFDQAGEEFFGVAAVVFDDFGRERTWEVISVKG